MVASHRPYKGVSTLVTRLAKVLPDHQETHVADRVETPASSGIKGAWRHSEDWPDSALAL